MNVGQMIIKLGFEPKVEAKGFPCLAIIQSRRARITDSAMIATPDQVTAAVDASKSPADRTLPKGRIGNWV